MNWVLNLRNGGIVSLKRILVGVDFRQPSLAAAQWTTAQFKDRSAIEIVYIDPVSETPGFLDSVSLAPDKAAGTTLMGKVKGLRGFVDTLQAGDIAAHVRVGQEVAELSSRAKIWEADLVVLGRSKASPAAGRTLHRLIRGLNVPALVIGPEGGTAPRRILVAVDDAPTAEHVVRWSSVLAKHFGARLNLLHVLSNRSIPGSAVPIDELGRSGLRRLRTTVNQAHSWLRHLYRETVQESFAGRTTVAIGSAGPVILEHSQATRADMIIVGRNGKHAVGPTELGTTSKLVLRGARVPITVVPPHRRQPHDQVRREMANTRRTLAGDAGRITYAEMEVFGPEEAQQEMAESSSKTL